MGDILGSYWREVKAREQMEYITHRFRESVRPFRPGKIWMATEGMGNTMYLHVSPKNWPSLATTIDISDLLYKAPDEIELMLAERVAEHFENIPYIEPDPRFGLGEN